MDVVILLALCVGIYLLILVMSALCVICLFIKRRIRLLLNYIDMTQETPKPDIRRSSQDTQKSVDGSNALRSFHGAGKQ